MMTNRQDKSMLLACCRRDGRNSEKGKSQGGIGRLIDVEAAQQIYLNRNDETVATESSTLWINIVTNCTKKA